MAALVQDRRGQVRAGYWWYWWIGADGRKRTRKGYVDRRATEEALGRDLKRVALEAEDLAVPDIEDLRRPLAEHVAAFIQHVGAADVTEAYVGKLRTRLLSILKRMGAGRFADVTRTKVEDALADMGREGFSKKTRGDYAAALKQFTGWVSPEHGWSNPLVGLKAPSGEDDVRMRRRALTMQELARLLDAAERRGVEEYRRRSPGARPETLRRLERIGMERSMIYRVGALVGLRPNEIKTLTWGDLVPACIT